MSEPAELALALYDASGNKLTEHLLLVWPAANPLSTVNPASPMLVVFTVSMSVLAISRNYML